MIYLSIYRIRERVQERLGTVSFSDNTILLKASPLFVKAPAPRPPPRELDGLGEFKSIAC